MDNGEMPMTYLTPIPSFGDLVWVPEDLHPHQWIAIVTTDPNSHGRVRIEWDDEKSEHHWGYYSQIELEPADDPRSVPSDPGRS